MAVAKAELKLTAKRLREVLSYDPETGTFVWIKAPSSLSRIEIGATAGSVMARGYLQLKIDTERYLAHRVAWFYMTGEWPEGLIDHRDGDPSNNRWLNLREATYRTNAENRRRAQGWKTGLPMGVSVGHMTLTGQSYKWQLDAFGGRLSRCGFRCPQAAHADYLEAKRMWHAGCTI